MSLSSRTQDEDKLVRLQNDMGPSDLPFFDSVPSSYPSGAIDRIRALDFTHFATLHLRWLWEFDHPFRYR